MASTAVPDREVPSSDTTTTALQWPCFVFTDGLIKHQTPMLQETPQRAASRDIRSEAVTPTTYLSQDEDEHSHRHERDPGQQWEARTRRPASA